MAKSINPAAGYILVEDLDPKDENQVVSGSSLELSGTNPHDQLKLGKVLRAGEDDYRDNRVCKSPAKTGDIIAYQSLSAHNLRVAGKQYRLVEFDHVIAIIGKEK